MGKIDEQATWEDNVYLIEKQDKVLGGKQGAINIQALQLANRTAYLKEQVEDLASGKASEEDVSSLRDLFIGIPIPHPLTTVPEGCLAMNGQRFDKARYPKLAQKYPSGQLPDLRGEFIRGWDNGRGVDAGRGVLSTQGDAIRNIVGQFKVTDLYANDYLSGAFEPYMKQSGFVAGRENLHIPLGAPGISEYSHAEGTRLNVSKVVPTANENRPRNIAFHYICLAA